MFSVTFWGVRGSIATPGPDTAQVGGNTSCVEVVCGQKRIVLDTGTGMRMFGQKLTKELRTGQLPVADLTVLYSHLHWDHLQGLPFFAPLYSPSSTLRFFGPKGVERALRTQMGEPGFPVRLDDVPSKLLFRELCEGMRVDLSDDLSITCARLNHPGGVLAYRIDYQGRSLVYATDTEHYSVPDPKLVRLASGADLLIYDAQYTPNEYDSGKKGWGHSTYAEGVKLARRIARSQSGLSRGLPSFARGLACLTRRVLRQRGWILRAIPRSSAMVFYTRAGAEIGVASTKAFTTQLIALFALVGTLAKLNGRLDHEAEQKLMEELDSLFSQLKLQYKQSKNK